MNLAEWTGIAIAQPYFIRDTNHKCTRTSTYDVAHSICGLFPDLCSDIPGIWRSLSFLILKTSASPSLFPTFQSLLFSSFSLPALPFPGPNSCSLPWNSHPSPLPPSLSPYLPPFPVWNGQEESANRGCYYRYAAAAIRCNGMPGRWKGYTYK